MHCIYTTLVTVISHFVNFSDKCSAQYWIYFQYFFAIHSPFSLHFKPESACIHSGRAKENFSQVVLKLKTVHKFTEKCQMKGW